MDSERVLTLLLPDWQHLDTVLENRHPFALWTVGAQPLLYHWLDHAVDEGYRQVRIEVSDRPAEVRRAMEEAQLWPIEWTVVPKARIETPSSQEDPDCVFVDRLPGLQSPSEAPSDGWELLRYWFALRKHWFDQVNADHHLEAFRTLAIGRFCSIHPTAKLQMPVWVEDYAQIGPGCVVGPYVNIGRGAVLEGPSTVENSVITAHTYLAGHTELRDCFLDGGHLLNLRLGARVQNLDRIVADSLQPDLQRPAIKERAYSALLYAGLSIADRLLPKDEGPTRRVWASFDGLELEEMSKGPLWRRRRQWLRHVVQGKMRLIGVLPRTHEQLDALSPDWQDILRSAPCGVIAYSDLHDSHSADDELEPIHAVYQASAPPDQMQATIRDQLWRLLKKRPGQ